MWSRAICAHSGVQVMSDASVPSMSYVIVVEAHISCALQQVIASLLEYEKPDFVALSGDMVSGFAWDGRKGWFEDRCSPFLADPQIAIRGALPDIHSWHAIPAYKIVVSCRCMQAWPWHALLYKLGIQYHYVLCNYYVVLVHRILSGKHTHQRTPDAHRDKRSASIFASAWRGA